MKAPKISRPITIFAFAALIFVMLFSAWNSDFCYVYRKHILSNSRLNLDFKDINSNTIEQEIKSKYPINWYCGFDNFMAEFGDYYCADELKSWNNVPALTVVLWFKNKKLNAMKVDIPFWQHQKMIAVLSQKYGKPTNIYHYKNKLKLLKNIAVFILTKGEYISDKNILVDEYAEWILPNRTMVSTTLEDDANPFSHSTILWRTY